MIGLLYVLHENVPNIENDKKLIFYFEKRKKRNSCIFIIAKFREQKIMIYFSNFLF